MASADGRPRQKRPLVVARLGIRVGVRPKKVAQDVLQWLECLVHLVLELLLDLFNANNGSMHLGAGGQHESNRGTLAGLLLGRLLELQEELKGVNAIKKGSACPLEGLRKLRDDKVRKMNHGFAIFGTASAREGHLVGYAYVLQLERAPESTERFRVVDTIVVALVFLANQHPDAPEVAARRRTLLLIEFQKELGKSCLQLKVCKTPSIILAEKPRDRAANLLGVHLVRGLGLARVAVGCVGVVGRGMLSNRH